MSIRVSDLSPKYQEQVLKKVMAQGAPVGTKSKYRNTPTQRTGAEGRTIPFDSQKEARRYDHLLLLLRAGAIRDLRLQVDFTLQEAYTDPEGRRVRAIRYRADFTYYRADGEYVVEDVKSQGTRTEKYSIKKKLMQERFGIRIQEV